jgi:hypothetical protein
MTNCRLQLLRCLNLKPKFELHSPDFDKSDEIVRATFYMRTVFSSFGIWHSIKVLQIRAFALVVGMFSVKSCKIFLFKWNSFFK